MVNSMPKTAGADRTGREGLFSEIRAQFELFDLVSDERNETGF
jgi:hypothetical protein